MVQDAKKRSQCMLTYSLLMKYSLIFDIVNNLGPIFNTLKDCILKEISVIYFDPTKLVDILEFMEHLIVILDKKSITSEFRTEPVTTSKKLPVNAATAKETKDTPEVIT